MFSKEYLALLKNFEGFYRKPYLCTAGACTIGYGTNLDAHPKYISDSKIRESGLKGRKLMDALNAISFQWDEEKAEEAMLDELTKTYEACKAKIPVFKELIEKGERVRMEALLDMAYNMGVVGLSRFVNTLKLVSNEEYKDAAWALVKSKWYKQVKRRGRAIFYMMFYGKYPTPAMVDKLPNYHIDENGIGTML